MGTCKECYHIEVCRIFDVTPCKHFKDHSLHVELPCKVGDYLYRPDRFGIGKYLVVGIQLLKSSRIDILWKLVDGVGIPTPYIDAKDIGKTVFLTREEAELELERKKYNDL